MTDDIVRSDRSTASRSATAPQAAPHSGPPAGTHERRLDIQGLRAVAVLAVVAYHLSPQRLSGGYVGVDVFFVISGFLITSHLLQSRLETGRDLRAFWGRRIRRLLPAALFVLACTLGATIALAPETRWVETTRHVMASALYVENWQLATDSTDYLQATDPPTAVQHFWSLAVEEQFYLVWPILILIVALFARRMKWRTRWPVAVAIAAVTIASFGYSIHETAVNPAVAYFSTPVRMWELAVGGLLAIIATSTLRLRFLRGVWSVLGLVGLLAIIAAAWKFSDTTAFPGWAAALPVGGAVVVIAAGSLSGKGVAGRLLSVPPLPFIGDISYSIYLWHWPLIVFVPYVTGPLGRREKVAIVLASIALAWLTKKLIEDPFRRPGITWVGRAPFRFALVGMLVVVMGGVAVNRIVDQRQAAEMAAAAIASANGAASSPSPGSSPAPVPAPDPCFGAGAMTLGPVACPYKSTDPVPGPLQAQADRTTLYDANCFENPPFDKMPTCTYGDPNAKISIALVGNSHAGEWFTALEALMSTGQFKITTFLADGCNVTTTRQAWNPDSDGIGCLNWGKQVMAATTSGKFTVVVTAAIETHEAYAAGKDTSLNQPLTKQGHLDELRSWVAAGSQVLVIRDTPLITDLLPDPDCIAKHTDNVQVCSSSRKTMLRPDPLFEVAQSMHSPDVTTVDLTDKFCDATTCYDVVGGVTVYYDTNHMTQTFVRTLAPYLAGPLNAAIQSAGSSTDRPQPSASASPR